MVLAMLDTMASLVARRLDFEYLINLSDADLTLRTDGEMRALDVGDEDEEDVTVRPPARLLLDGA